MATQQTIGTSGSDTSGSDTSASSNVPARAGRRSPPIHDREVKSAPWHDSDFVASEKDPITNFLGWLSIGLGLAELFAPQKLARLIGIDEDDHTTLLRAYGVRELAAGVGILTRPKPTYWMWNRVLGDTIDLASIRRAMISEGSDNSRLKLAALAVAGVTALDIVSSMRLTSERSPAAGEDPGSYKTAEGTSGTAVTSAVVTVNKPIEQVYEFWKDPRNYALFMDHIESVKPSTGGRSRWKIKAPPGLSIEWEAQMTQDMPNELIRWSSTEESSINNTGTVRFSRAAGDRGTVVTLAVEYKPRAGALGAAASRFFKTIPKTEMSNDLRRFKQIIEVGEVVKSDATAVPGTHSAQPPELEQLEGRS